jgi:hypothetical protein
MKGFLVAVGACAVVLFGCGTEMVDEGQEPSSAAVEQGNGGLASDSSDLRASDNYCCSGYCKDHMGLKWSYWFSRPNVTVNCADRIQEQCVAAGSYPGYYEAVWTPTCYSHHYPS